MFTGIICTEVDPVLGERLGSLRTQLQPLRDHPPTLLLLETTQQSIPRVCLVIENWSSISAWEKAMSMLECNKGLAVNTPIVESH